MLLSAVGKRFLYRAPLGTHSLLRGERAPLHRFLSSSSSSSLGGTGGVCDLSERRALVEISGEQSFKLLQGLITNDMERLSEQDSIYTHILNVRGRIMFDSLIYKLGTHRYLLEVDRGLVPMFVKVLSMYNIRCRAKITPTEERLFASFGTSATLDTGHADPRLPSLGSRHLGSPPDSLPLAPIAEYDRWRVGLGVSEGSRDITSDKDFPFEHNLDYLQGVSFTKGCYIGQELTARTHHVGETRKRVVPVSITDGPPPSQLPVRLLAGKRGAGKLLSVYGDSGLAIIRLPFLNSPLSVDQSSASVIGRQPEWWPE